MAYIDTNVFLYVIDENSQKDFREASIGILKRVEEGEASAISALTLMEVLWWCEKHTRARIKEIHDSILSYRTLEIINLTPDVISDALFFKEKYRLEINDCISLATMASTGITGIYSNDTGFDKVEWTKRTFK